MNLAANIYIFQFYFSVKRNVFIIYILLGCLPREGDYKSVVGAVSVVGSVGRMLNHHKMPDANKPSYDHRLINHFKCTSLGNNIQQKKLFGQSFTPQIDSVTRLTKIKNRNDTQKSSKSLLDSKKQVSTGFKTVGANVLFKSLCKSSRDSKLNVSLNKRKRGHNNASAISKTKTPRCERKKRKRGTEMGAKTTEVAAEVNNDKQILIKDKRHAQLIRIDSYIRRKTIPKEKSDLIRKFQGDKELEADAILLSNAINHAYKKGIHGDDVSGRNVLFMKIAGENKKLINETVTMQTNDTLMKALRGNINFLPSQYVTKHNKRKRQITNESLQNSTNFKQSFRKHQNHSKVQNSLNNLPNFLQTSTHSTNHLPFKPDLILHMNIGRNATATVYAYKPPKVQKLVQCCFKTPHKEYDSRGM